MPESGVPDLTPDMEKKIREALVRQFEDQYGVKVIVAEGGAPAESE